MSLVGFSVPSQTINRMFSLQRSKLGSGTLEYKYEEERVIEFLAAVGSIILIDLVLSGDNALVIGAAAAGLPRRQRWYAIVLGGGGAIVLRIVFAIIATLLLRFPLLQAI